MTDIHRLGATAVGGWMTEREQTMTRQQPLRYPPLAAGHALTFACALLLASPAARADALKIENVKVTPRDANTATVRFDIAWENAWRHGSFHDATWVFFKARGDRKSDWQHVRLAADKVVNPTGYGQAKGGTPLEFVVPAGDEGYLGMFVRRTKQGKGAVTARGVTAVWDLKAAPGIGDIRKTKIRAFGIEMVYVAEGPFYLGSGGRDLNRFYKCARDDRDVPQYRRQVLQAVVTDDEGPPYRVTGPGAIPTGRQKGKLWAAGITPVDDGEIPASFPNGYASFYCMKHPYITQGQYAGFLNTLTTAQAKARYHVLGHGPEIERSGKSPNYTYSASAPDKRCPWLSWTDCTAFAAWAGLRPMTDLEYEKAIRGPQDSVPYGASPSYWGAAGFNMGGHYERPVSAGSATGRRFAGTHGRGTPALPTNWPTDVGGAVFRNQVRVGSHLRTSGRSNAIDVFADRGAHPYAGWRAARSAPAGDAAVGPIPVRTLGHRIARLGRRVRADGVLDEWGKPTLTLNGPADLFPVYRRLAPFNFYGRLVKPWQGPEDLSAKVYLGWDGEVLCIAAEVTDEQHVNTKTGDGISKGDVLQMGLATAKMTHWNIALALTKAGVALHQYAGQGDTLVKTAGCAVARDDKARATRYELRLPMAALGLKPGDEFGFNIVFFDDDDSNANRYWLQLAPGLAGQHPNTTLYPRLVLAKQTTGGNTDSPGPGKRQDKRLTSGKP